METKSVLWNSVWKNNDGALFLYNVNASIFSFDIQWNKMKLIKTKLKLSKGKWLTSCEIKLWNYLPLNNAHVYIGSKRFRRNQTWSNWELLNTMIPSLVLCLRMLPNSEITRYSRIFSESITICFHVWSDNLL